MMPIYLESVPLRKVVLNQGWFCPSREHVSTSEDTFACYNWEVSEVSKVSEDTFACYWHLVGKSSGG